LPYAGTSSFNKDRGKCDSPYSQKRVADGSTFIPARTNWARSFLDLEGKNSSGNYKIFEPVHDPDEGWELVQPYRDDGFLVLIEDVPYPDRRAMPGSVGVTSRFHHDMAVNEEGDIYALPTAS